MEKTTTHRTGIFRCESRVSELPVRMDATQLIVRNDGLWLHSIHGTPPCRWTASNTWMWPPVLIKPISCSVLAKGEAGALHTEHLGEKFLSQRQRIAC